MPRRIVDISVALKAGIARDCDAARAFFASTHAETRRQTTRDRI